MVLKFPWIDLTNDLHMTQEAASGKPSIIKNYQNGLAMINFMGVTIVFILANKFFQPMMG